MQTMKRGVAQTLEVRTIEDAKRFLRIQRLLSSRSNAYPCRHGHYDCSIREHGPCLDETLSEYPELDN